MSLIQIWYLILTQWTSGSRHTRQQALVLGREPVRCFTQEDALYVAHLIHRDWKAGIKVVHYVPILPAFQMNMRWKLVEKQIAQQWTKRLEDEEE
jgi:hypothetical protein